MRRLLQGVKWIGATVIVCCGVTVLAGLIQSQDGIKILPPEGQGVVAIFDSCPFDPCPGSIAEHVDQLPKAFSETYELIRGDLRGRPDFRFSVLSKDDVDLINGILWCESDFASTHGMEVTLYFEDGTKISVSFLSYSRTLALLGFVNVWHNGKLVAPCGPSSWLSNYRFILRLWK